MYSYIHSKSEQAGLTTSYSSYISYLIYRDLFNAAFVSCWTELTETQQDELILNLEQALTSQEIPEITQTILNLAEFMEHCDKVRMRTITNSK